MNQREDFGYFVPLVWAALWLWVFAAVDNWFLRFFAAASALYGIGYAAKRRWYRRSHSVDEISRAVDEWREAGRTGRRPLLPVEVQEQARWKKLRDLERDLREDEFESLKALIDAHYFGYPYNLSSLAIDHMSDGRFSSYSVSPESDERIRTAFLKHKDKFDRGKRDA